MCRCIFECIRKHEGGWIACQVYQSLKYHNEDSAKYFKACGEPQPEPWRTSYGRGSGGSFSAEYITLEDGKILHIDCKRYRYLTALTNFLLEKYPEDFSELKDCFPPSTTSESPTAYFDGLKRKLYCETLSPSDKKAA